MLRNALAYALVPPALFGALALTLSACGDDRPRPTASAQARDAASAVLDAFAAGDYGRSWDGLDGSSQALVSRADWVRLYTRLCKPVTEGQAFTVQDVQVAGAGATVRIARGGVLSLWRAVRLESGAWRMRFPADLAEGFSAESVEELAADWDSLGLCQFADDDDLDLHWRVPTPGKSAKTTGRATSPAVSALPRSATPAPSTAKQLPAQGKVADSSAQTGKVPAAKAPAVKVPAKGR